MIRNSLLLALCAATLSYLSLTLVFSSYGLLEHKRHNEYADQLRSNLSELELTNTQLLRRIEDLRTLSDVVVIEGRGIGLYRPNEGVIRVVGYPNPGRLSETASPGRMMRSMTEGRNHYPWIRAVALSVGLLVLVIGMAWGRNTSRRVRRGSGITSQFGPQSSQVGRAGALQPRKVS